MSDTPHSVTFDIIPLLQALGVRHRKDEYGNVLVGACDPGEDGERISIGPYQGSPNTWKVIERSIWWKGKSTHIECEYLNIATCWRSLLAKLITLSDKQDERE